MKTLVSVVLWLLIDAGIVADRLYGVEFAGNISIFIIWFFTIMSFVAVLVIDKEKLKETSNRIAIRSSYFLGLVLMIAAGWFVTAAFSIAAWIILYAKKSAASEDDAAKST